MRTNWFFIVFSNSMPKKFKVIYQIMFVWNSYPFIFALLNCIKGECIYYIIHTVYVDDLSCILAWLLFQIFMRYLCVSHSIRTYYFFIQTEGNEKHLSSRQSYLILCFKSNYFKVTNLFEKKI